MMVAMEDKRVSMMIVMGDERVPNFDPLVSPEEFSFKLSVGRRLLTRPGYRAFVSSPKLSAGPSPSAGSIATLS